MQTFETPQKLDSFFVEQSVVNLLKAVQKRSRTQAVNVLVKGKQGCGKTALGKQFAAINERPYAEFQVGLLAESGQLFGSQVLHDGNVEYERYAFLDAIQTEDIVINLDEFNRAQNAKAMNGIFSVLDDRREVRIDELAEIIPVHPTAVFFATLNEGIEFSGIDLLDAALSDRFYVVHLDILQANQEKALLQSRTKITAEQADKLVEVITAARHNDVFISTRKMLSMGSLLFDGLDLRESILFSLNADQDTTEKVLMACQLKEA